jgi:hypothetical protein
MKKSTTEDWEEIGQLAKWIDQELKELTVKASKVTNAYAYDSLKRATNHLNKFRTRAEDHMFSKGIKDTNIFYGGDDGARE